MENKPEYRILEHQGLFYVEYKRLVKYTPGLNLLHNLSVLGLFVLPYAIWLEFKHRKDPLIEEWVKHPACPHFKSFDKAKYWINLTEQPDKIHYLDGRTEERNS